MLGYSKGRDLSFSGYNWKQLLGRCSLRVQSGVDFWYNTGLGIGPGTLPQMAFRLQERSRGEVGSACL
jgi:hypothetical protein